jgi:thiamine pyrophosphokinase
MDKEKFIREIKEYTVISMIGPIHHRIQAEKVANSPLVFVDGGVDFKAKLKMKCEQFPHISLGDGDSKQSLDQLDLQFSAEKDQTDLQLALDLVQTQQEIQAWGFSGGRFDHHLSNLGAFYQHSENFRAKVILDDEVLFLPTGKTQFEYHGYFSLLAVYPTEISLKGEVKYPLQRPTLLTSLSGRGVSNQAMGKVNLTSSNPVLMIPVENSCSQIKIL